MHRTVLGLNVVVLLVNFFLSFSATDSNIGILQSASRAAGLRIGGSGVISNELSTAYLRVSQSLESVLPPDRGRDVTVAQRQALFDAVERYYAAVREGVAGLMMESDKETLDQAAVDLGVNARIEVERVLMTAFPNHEDVSRLATEVVRNCR